MQMQCWRRTEQILMLQEVTAKKIERETERERERDCVRDEISDHRKSETSNMHKRNLHYYQLFLFIQTEKHHYPTALQHPGNSLEQHIQRTENSDNSQKRKIEHLQKNRKLITPEHAFMEINEML